MIGKWIRNYVRNNVLQGFADAIEQLNPSVEESPDTSIPERLRAVLTPALPSLPAVEASEESGKGRKRTSAVA